MTMRYKEWLEEWTKKTDANRYKVIGRVSNLKVVETKKKHIMAFVDLEDSIGKIETVIFSKIWERANGYFKENAVLVLTGKVDKHNEKPKLIVDNVWLPEELSSFNNRELHDRDDLKR